jgi:hypothetical protein
VSRGPERAPLSRSDPALDSQGDPFTERLGDKRWTWAMGTCNLRVWHQPVTEKKNNTTSGLVMISTIGWWSTRRMVV